MADICRRTFVPVVHRDLAPVMAVVAGCVVDQHMGGPDAFLQPCKGRLQRLNVAQIAGFEQHLAICRIGQSLAPRRINIDETNAASLPREFADQIGADPRGAPGDKHGLPLE